MSSATVKVHLIRLTARRSYNTVEQSGDNKGISPPASWSVSDLEDWLMQHSASVNPGMLVSPGINVFDQGFDRQVTDLFWRAAT